MTEKEFETWLVLDYKTGKFRVVSPKTKLERIKNSLKGTEIPINLKFMVLVPATPILTATGRIELSQMEISKLILSELEEKNNIQ